MRPTGEPFLPDQSKPFPKLVMPLVSEQLTSSEDVDPTQSHFNKADRILTSALEQ